MALLTILTAGFKAGKTQAAFELVKSSKAIWFVSSPANKQKDLVALPWKVLRDIEPDLVQKVCTEFRQLRFVVADRDAELLASFKSKFFAGYVFLFDDMPTLFYSAKAKKQLEVFFADVRQHDLRIIITTQRVQGILPPFSRLVADEVIQVGPLLDEEEARALFRMSGRVQYRTFTEFYDVISANPKYKRFQVKG